MNIKNVQKQKGFTLVEIAIVLVIIGLLLGGVLKGQELITNAKIKAVTSDFDGISAAYYAYQDRTGHAAGDKLSSAYDGVIADNLIWSDLRREGFITGVDTVLTGPTHDLDGRWIARPGAAVGSAMFITNHICATNITDTFAQGMDTKMDDGDPARGSIRAGDQDAIDTIAASAAADVAIAVDTAYGATGTDLVTICKEL
jgi:prepilin-type N-terminal cleavage/methylation domain-containing protein